MNLSSASLGRDNNYNLLRIIAAFAVLFTHSFALATGNADAEPLRTTLGMTLGDLAVDIFFIISGFLVTGSLLKTGSTNVFLWHRFLRIYPALVLMLLMTVFGLGLFFTSLTWRQYLANREVYSYLFHGITLIRGVRWSLPGVFEHNPLGPAINGALWSLPFEVLMYVLLAAIFMGLRFFRREGFRVFRIIVVCLAVCFGGAYLVERLVCGESSTMVRCSFMFFTGVSYFILRGEIRLCHSLFWVAIAALFLTAWSRQLFFSVYAVTLAYIVMYLAYVPSRIIRKYNRLGDYSYGVYIYAFPVQQSLAAILPGISVASMLLLSSCCTLILAVSSWHFLEKYALSVKGQCIDFTTPCASFAKNIARKVAASLTLHD
jgi:peptidoglycan/LPS O-acetylase OafA/YrhL